MSNAVGLGILVVLAVWACWHGRRLKRLDARVDHLDAKVDDLADVRGIFERTGTRQPLRVVEDLDSSEPPLRRRPGVAMIVAGLGITGSAFWIAGPGEVAVIDWSVPPETSETAGPATGTTIAPIDSAHPRTDPSSDVPVTSTTTAPPPVEPAHRPPPVGERVTGAPPATPTTTRPPDVEPPPTTTTTAVATPLTTSTTVANTPTVDPDPETPPSTTPPVLGGVLDVVAG